MANPENVRIPKVQKEPISAYAALGSVCFHLLFYYTASGFAIAKMPFHPEGLWDRTIAYNHIFRSFDKSILR